MVEFAGWKMPVQYGSILEEVRAVRERAGLFDLCHMGRVEARGARALVDLDRLVTNEVRDLPAGRARYGLLCDEAGGVLDDLIVYRPAGSEDPLVVVNASNLERDLAWMRRNAPGTSFVDRTEEIAMLAIQGPRAQEILSPLTDLDLGAVRYFGCGRGRLLDLERTLFARTGYTGEDGFELFLPAERAERVWEDLLRAGAGEGLRPIGLGARDTLRLEAGLPLYGHEIDESTNPIEAGLAFAVRFAPGREFLGRAALEAVAARGPARRVVGLRASSKRIPRQGYPVLHGGNVVGRVCSGGLSPTLGTTIGTAIVPSNLAEAGTSLEVDVRGERQPVEVVPLPFFHRRRRSSA
jgi:aminomethyltransferase